MFIIKATGKIMGDYYFTPLDGLNASRDKAKQFTIEGDAYKMLEDISKRFSSFTLSVEPK